MPATDPMRREAADRGFPAGTSVALVASSVLLLAALLGSAWTLPSQLVLPTVCLAALAAAGAVALFAWRGRARDHRHPNYWDVAGALTFVGLCAAMLSEPDQVWPLLEAAPRRD